MRPKAIHDGLKTKAPGAWRLDGLDLYAWTGSRTLKVRLSPVEKRSRVLTLMRVSELTGIPLKSLSYNEEQ
jgi:hypothetical protein